MHCGGSGCLRAPLVAVAVGVALVASTLGPSVVYAAPAKAPVQLASGGRPAIPAGELGGPFTAASVRSAEVVLAHSGVATVADEKSKVALVAVTGPVADQLHRAQVQAMALSAADGGGVWGSALDAVARRPRAWPPSATCWRRGWPTRQRRGPRRCAPSWGHRTGAGPRRLSSPPSPCPCSWPTSSPIPRPRAGAPAKAAGAAG